jgi:hypothetical protein
MFQVAIIIINYNTSKYTIDCIESIYKQTSQNISFQVIVVDNYSNITDYKLLESYLNINHYKNLKLVRNTINAGFGGGNMFGIQYADSKYYAFINNDTVLLNDCISILKKEIESNTSIGVCGPKNITANGNFLSTLDHFASLKKEIIGRKFLEFINPKKYSNRRFEYTKNQKGQLISGSFMFIKASDFISVGGFDTNIFLYHEETDLCLRLQKIKKYAYFIPEAKIIHHHGASSEKSIQIKTEIKISLLYVIKKHHGYLHYKILLTFLQIRYFFTSIFKPEYWYLFKILFRGGRLTDSLKHKQNNK